MEQGTAKITLNCKEKVAQQNLKQEDQKIIIE